jgi:hypothetical protein
MTLASYGYDVGVLATGDGHSAGEATGELIDEGDGVA